MKKLSLLSFVFLLLSSCSGNSNEPSLSENQNNSVVDSSSIVESTISSNESTEESSSIIENSSSEENNESSEFSSSPIDQTDIPSVSEPEQPSESSESTPEDPSESTVEPSESAPESPSEPSESTPESPSVSEPEQPSEPSDSTDEPIEDPLKDGWTNTDFGDYYDGIDTSSSTLLADLRKLNAKERTFTVGYKNMWSYFHLTDYDPNNSSKYLAYYNGKSSSRSDMNKEHVWPNSRGGNLVEADIHVIRPTLTADNSSRGNSFYVEGKNSTVDGWDPKAAGQVERYRGDAARIVFYSVVANSSLSLVDLENDSTGNKTMGKLSDLLKWNLQYPVDQSELNRNNGAEGIQGNRNPFIDNPGFACAIWGNTNASTKQICSGSYVPEVPPTEPSDPDIDDEPVIEGDWTLVNSLSDLSSGDIVVLANYTNKAVAGELSTTSNPYLQSLSASFASDNKSITSLPSGALMFEINSSGNLWTFTCESKLLGCTDTKKMAFNQGVTTWTINISNGVADVFNSHGYLQYNSSHPRFTTYSSGQNPINIYKLNA